MYRHHYDGARWSQRYADTPTAAYACRCGQTRTATGQRDVAALIAEYDHHGDLCPLPTPKEGKAADERPDDDRHAHRRGRAA
ncbi:hypothetical protein ACFYZT_12040 [Streptomyces sp. NPDC001591]|uniref:hypothetical protein n=1 Tax=Streptomyces sp. NPDC001591 TaxID=3364589 RepID=UPI0036B73AE1